tara:strand:+ start:12113 stop:14677 length:2565 start_codon:yes stop_codon:yes gene_type:complete
MNNKLKILTVLKIYIFLFLCFVGCSTQKDSAANRIYHQINTKYNGLFYAEQYLKEGVRKVEKSHEDNYKETLFINKYSSMEGAKAAQSSFDKAIEKSTLAIQKHSMDIDGEEKNKLIDQNYMIIGQANFYKKDYSLALKTFNYIVRKSKNEELRTDALIWTTRCHYALQNKEVLRKNIRILKEEYFLNKTQESILHEIEGEVAISEGYYLEAQQHLIKSLKNINSKSKKTRINYILGQLSLLLNEPQSALNYFNQVIKSNPEYEMVFNAKLMRTKTYVSNQESFTYLSRDLQKMIKDTKNAEYKDQIYFTLAQLQLKNKDTISGIESLQLSTKNHISNNNQKLASHFLLALLFWDQQNYIKAYNHCDSAYQLTEKKSPNYSEIKKMLRSSKKIASKYIIINYNDSVVSLAKLPEKERISIIDNYIDSLKQKDVEEKINTETSPQSNFNSYEYNRQSQNSMSITSGGGWYFYNPSAMSLGYSEFLSRWGNRKLEDNWRRKNKNQANLEEELGLDAPSLEPTKEEKYNRDYYLEQLPLKEEDQLALLAKVEAAYYDLGVLFKDEVEDYPQAIATYNALTERFPKTDYRQLIYFDLYGVYVLKGDTINANRYLLKIEKEYPDSDYLDILSGKKPKNKKLEKDKEVYRTAHNLYVESSEESCIKLKQIVNESQDNVFVAQIELMYTFCGAKKLEKNEFIGQLEAFRKKHPSTQAANKVDSMLLVLKGEAALATHEIYSNEFDTDHYFIITIEDLSINLPETQSTISKFNTQTHKLDSLETINLLLTKELQLLRVGNFNNKKTASAYYSLIREHTLTKETILNKNIKPFIISQNNYQKLLSRKNINEYIQYFNEIYLLN